MKSKTVPSVQLDTVDAVTLWVDHARDEGNSSHCAHQNEVSSSRGEIMKRFTIDVSEDLHKRIKAQCALRGAKMADVMREILEHEFPKR